MPTNEEIREEIYKECPVNTWQTVDLIQDLTRTDERNRIIKEIEGYVSQELSEYDYSETDSYHAMAHTIYGCLIDKLTSLKQ